MTQRITTYREFWPYYLRQHSEVGTRNMHYVGTALTLLFLGIALWQGDLVWLAGIPLAGYGFAWVSHFGIEHNKPATWTYPLWSLVSDYRMFGLWLVGRLNPHLVAAQTAKRSTR